jgi:hypothetical protein
MRAERTDRRSLHLVDSGDDRATEMKKLNVGDQVPESGIYQVTHQQHRVPHEVTLLRGERFPPCEKCDGAVSYEMVRLAPGISDTKGLIVLRALPVMEEVDRDEETDAAAAS